MWSKDRSVGSMLPFHLQAGSRDWAVVIRLAHWALYWLSHLTGPIWGNLCRERGGEQTGKQVTRSSQPGSNEKCQQEALWWEGRWKIEQQWGTIRWPEPNGQNIKSPSIPRKDRHRMVRWATAQWDRSVACHQACGLGFNPEDPRDWRRETILESCPSSPHMHSNTCVSRHTQNKSIFFLKKMPIFLTTIGNKHGYGPFGDRFV